MHGILAPEAWISKQEKPVPMFSKHVSKHNKTLQPAYIWKHFQIVRVKRQDNLQTTTEILMQTEVNRCIYFEFKLNFHLITLNCQKL